MLLKKDWTYERPGLGVNSYTLYRLIAANPEAPFICPKEGGASHTCWAYESYQDGKLTCKRVGCGTKYSLRVALPLVLDSLTAFFASQPAEWNMRLDNRRRQQLVAKVQQETQKQLGTARQAFETALKSKHVANRGAKPRIVPARCTPDASWEEVNALSDAHGMGCDLTTQQLRLLTQRGMLPEKTSPKKARTPLSNSVIQAALTQSYDCGPLQVNAANLSIPASSAAPQSVPMTSVLQNNNVSADELEESNEPIQLPLDLGNCTNLYAEHDDVPRTARMIRPEMNSAVTAAPMNKCNGTDQSSITESVSTQKFQAESNSSTILEHADELQETPTPIPMVLQNQNKLQDSSYDPATAPTLESPPISQSEMTESVACGPNQTDSASEQIAECLVNSQTGTASPALAKNAELSDATDTDHEFYSPPLRRPSKPSTQKTTSSQCFRSSRITAPSCVDIDVSSQAESEAPMSPNASSSAGTTAAPEPANEINVAPTTTHGDIILDELEDTVPPFDPSKVDVSFFRAQCTTEEQWAEFQKLLQLPPTMPKKGSDYVSIFASNFPQWNLEDGDTNKAIRTNIRRMQFDSNKVANICKLGRVTEFVLRRQFVQRFRTLLDKLGIVNSLVYNKKHSQYGGQQSPEALLQNRAKAYASCIRRYSNTLNVKRHHCLMVLAAGEELVNAVKNEGVDVQALLRNSSSAITNPPPPLISNMRPGQAQHPINAPIRAMRVMLPPYPKTFGGDKDFQVVTNRKSRRQATQQLLQKVFQLDKSNMFDVLEKISTTPAAFGETASKPTSDVYVLEKQSKSKTGKKNKGNKNKAENTVKAYSTTQPPKSLVSKTDSRLSLNSDDDNASLNESFPPLSTTPPADPDVHTARSETPIVDSPRASSYGTPSSNITEDTLTSSTVATKNINTNDQDNNNADSVNTSQPLSLTQPPGRLGSKADSGLSLTGTVKKVAPADGTSYSSPPKAQEKTNLSAPGTPQPSSRFGRIYHTPTRYGYIKPSIVPEGNAYV